MRIITVRVQTSNTFSQKWTFLAFQNIYSPTFFEINTWNLDVMLEELTQNFWSSRFLIKAPEVEISNFEIWCTSFLMIFGRVDIFKEKCMKRGSNVLGTKTKLLMEPIFYLGIISGNIEFWKCPPFQKSSKMKCIKFQNSIFPLLVP